jgi:hypothetical protein
MIFKDFIQNIRQQTNINADPKTISVYPIGENNLEGIKILIDNCFRMGGENNNVKMATVDPSLWLGDFLDKHWNKISYVTSLPTFMIMKVIDNKVISKQYSSETKEFESEELVNEFFEKALIDFVERHKKYGNE